MKKKLIHILALALAVSMLSGCSLFATGGGDKVGSSGSSGAVKMTESYTFEDPADLDFDTRYVIYSDENSQMVSAIPAEYGIKGSYSIIYAKDDAPVADYEFFVCDSAEHAQAAADLYATQGQNLLETEGDPCVRYAFTDGDTMEGTLVTLQSFGAIKDTTVSGYVEFMQSTTGGRLME